MRNSAKLRIFGAAAAVLLLACPALAVPQVVTLSVSVGDSSGDPLAACGDLAASPFEAGRDGRGVADDQIFLDGAIAACEAALAAAPDSADAQAWLGRVYILVGRANDARPLLEQSAANGSGFGAYLLSRLYGSSLDNTVAEDPEQAVALLAQAADGGFAPAASDLAERYETGSGVDIDYAEALRLYQQAADAGHGYATYKLGYFYHAAYGVDADFARAMSLYQQAADLGEPLGNNGVGQLYEFGQGVAQDYAKAGEFYQLAADKGEKMSQTSLAYFYEQGLGVEQSYDRSFALLSDAARQGYGFAQAALSIHYLFGQGTTADAVKAYDLAWAAQREGVTYAEGILGYMFAEGLGTNRDLSSALFHFQAGAERGDQYSADRIPVTEAEIACLDAAGSQYEPGNVGHGLDFFAIDADMAIAACDNALQLNPGSLGDKVWLARAYVRGERYQDAIPLLEEGMAAGNVLADVVYGDMLMIGSGVPQDQGQAIARYETAAAKSFALAQFQLGLAYAQGLGVAADQVKALEWLRLALNNGVNDAQVEIDQLVAGPVDSGIDLSGFGREGPGY